MSDTTSIDIGIVSSNATYNLLCYHCLKHPSLNLIVAGNDKAAFSLLTEHVLQLVLVPDGLEKRNLTQTVASVSLRQADARIIALVLNETIETQIKQAELDCQIVHIKEQENMDIIAQGWKLRETVFNILNIAEDSETAMQWVSEAKRAGLDSPPPIAGANVQADSAVKGTSIPTAESLFQTGLTKKQQALLAQIQTQTVFGLEDERPLEKDSSGKQGLEWNIIQLENKNLMLQYERDMLVHMAAKLQQSFTDARNRYKDMYTHLTAFNTEKESQAHKLSQYRADARQQQHLHTQKISSLESKLQAVENENTKMRERLKQLEEENRHLQQKTAELLGEFDDTAH